MTFHFMGSTIFHVFNPESFLKFHVHYFRLKWNLYPEIPVLLPTFLQNQNKTEPLI